MRNRGFFRFIIFSLLCAVFITGCGTTPPAVFYTLSPMADAGATRPVTVSDPIAIGIGPRIDGRVRRGDLLLLEAFGGGFTWGSSLVRY